jgi:transcription-repair coupling factor (superfamily II helicase)
LPFDTDVFSGRGRFRIAGAPPGFDGRVLAELAAAGSGARAGAVIVIARDDVRLAQLAESLAFFAPHIEHIELPAWDCLPYDRVSPHAEIVGRRIDALARLGGAGEEAPSGGPPRVLLTTIAAALQRMPPAD